MNSLRLISEKIKMNNRYVLPINTENIRNFKQWINWNGFNTPIFFTNHCAFDFTTYITHNNECFLGLPEKTSIIAVDDGIVSHIKDFSNKKDSLESFYNTIVINHKDFIAGYTHIYPLVNKGQSVKGGDLIATLWKYDGKNPKGRNINLSIRLPHLHFEIEDKYGHYPPILDPCMFFPELKELIAYPQKEEEFAIYKKYLGFIKFKLNPQPKIIKNLC